MPGHVRNFLLARIAVCIALIGCCASCAAAAADYPPVPAGWRNAQEREELVRLTRSIAREPWASKRFALIGELQQLVGGIESTKPGDASENEGIPLFIVHTVFVALRDDPPRSGGNERLGDAIGDMPRRIPKELVAAGLTEPKDWVDGLWDQTERGGTISLAMTLMESAGGFELLGGPAGWNRFPHLSGILTRDNIKRAYEIDMLDPVFHRMLVIDAYGATVQLILEDRPLGGNDNLEQRLETLRQHYNMLRRLLLVEIYLEEQETTWLVKPDDPPPPLPYDAPDQKLMLELATESHWPIHLYLWEFMWTHESWRDPQVIRAIAAHGHPISLRFLSSTNMLDDLPGELPPPTATQPSTRPAEGRP